MKITDGGAIVPIDTTDAEVKHMLEFDRNRLSGRVFPLHFPTDPLWRVTGDESNREDPCVRRRSNG
jgi:hypothetical protein